MTDTKTDQPVPKYEPAPSCTPIRDDRTLGEMFPRTKRSLAALLVVGVPMATYFGVRAATNDQTNSVQTINVTNAMQDRAARLGDTARWGQLAPLVQQEIAGVISNEARVYPGEVPSTARQLLDEIYGNTAVRRIAERHVQAFDLHFGGLLARNTKDGKGKKPWADLDVVALMKQIRSDGYQPAEAVDVVANMKRARNFDPMIAAVLPEWVTYLDPALVQIDWSKRAVEISSALQMLTGKTDFIDAMKTIKSKGMGAFPDDMRRKLAVATLADANDLLKELRPHWKDAQEIIRGTRQTAVATTKFGSVRDIAKQALAEYDAARKQTGPFLELAFELPRRDNTATSVDQPQAWSVEATTTSIPANG